MERLRGVNLGGWLLMEGYILGGRNIPEHEIKSLFQKVHGKKGKASFEALYRNCFITPEDIARIRSWGANCIRVPFHYQLIESAPYRYNREGIARLEKVLTWAGDQKVKVILDLHAACGAQNADWHSDSTGKAMLWKDASCRERTFALWEMIADRFKDHKALYGYDLLNEPVVSGAGVNMLARFYKRLIRRIRSVDRDHVIFVEGNRWAQEVDFLEDILSERVHLSIHAYAPLEYTFNFVPYLRYPGRINNEKWDKNRVYNYLKPYYEFSRRAGVPVFVGEFGVNWRGGFYGEKEYLCDFLDACETFGFHYTYWTYKAVRMYAFPDGIFQYLGNPGYVCREGPVYGWENYSRYWKKDKQALAEMWGTDSFTFNKTLGTVLKNYFRRNGQ